MPKISGQVVSTKPVSLSRAAKHITRFASIPNVSTPAVALYLERTAEAFNHLVQFHKNPSEKPDLERIQKLQSDWVENNLDDEDKDLSNGGDGEIKKEKKKKRKRKGELVDDSAEKEKKKKKKKKKNR